MATDRKSPATREVSIEVKPAFDRDVGGGSVHRAAIAADWTMPPAAHGVVVFAHGSGSSRKSTRNRYVAGVLNDAGFATLLVDLLTPSEARLDELTGELRFHVPLLCERVLTAVAWVLREPNAAPIVAGGGRIGLFGASTGAAAALAAAAAVGPEVVGAVVSRGGRPDLARSLLHAVHAPTLLIVGANDVEVLHLNELAHAELRSCTKKLAIVPGATHLFEEEGALEEVAHLASHWFTAHLADHLMYASAR